MLLLIYAISRGIFACLHGICDEENPLRRVAPTYLFFLALIFQGFYASPIYTYEFKPTAGDRARRGCYGASSHFIIILVVPNRKPVIYNPTEIDDKANFPLKPHSYIQREDD